MVYYLVALTALLHSAPWTVTWLDKLRRIPPVAAGLGVLDRLEVLALEVCGIAFSADSPAVLSNSLGPIFYCGSYPTIQQCLKKRLTSSVGAKFVRDEGCQQELVRRLHASRALTGLPVQRLIDSLRQHWAAHRDTRSSAKLDWDDGLIP